MLVGLQRHHVEEERVSTSPGGSPSKRAVLFPIRSDDLQLLLVYAWVFSRPVSGVPVPKRNDDERERRGN